MAFEQECMPPTLIATHPEPVVVESEVSSADIDSPDHDHDHHHGHDIDPLDYQSKRSAYLGAFIAIAVVSITSVIGISLAPLASFIEYIYGIHFKLFAYKQFSCFTPFSFN